MTRCLLGIGSNLGDRAAQMDAATDRLRIHDEIDVLSDSGWQETDPVGGPEKQQSYLNGAIVVETELGPLRLLQELLKVERTLGREREQRWGPRSVDLDLLLFGNQTVNETGLTVPHPWMAVRRFVLDPAASVAPEMVHPEIGWTLERLAKNLRAQPLLIAINGIETEEKKAAISAAAESSGAFFSSTDLLEQPAMLSEGSAISDTVEPLELAGTLGEATKRQICEAQESQQNGVFLFDVTNHPQKKIDNHDSFLPNLVIEVAGAVPKKFDGPTLQLGSDDLDRLQHDLAAAIQGMQ